MSKTKFYRVTILDSGNNGRWLEARDFPNRPNRDLDLCPGNFPKLNRAEGGRFEIRVGVVHREELRGGTNEEEVHLYGWQVTRPARNQEPGTPVHDSLTCRLGAHCPFPECQ